MSFLRTSCCDQVVRPGTPQVEERPPRGRVAMLSVHTCPLAMLGGKNTGGMNVYVRELSRELGRRGWAVDIYTHAESLSHPAVVVMARNVRVIHTVAGPVAHVGKNELYNYLPEFTENVLAMAAAEDLSYDVVHSHYWLSGLVAERLRAAWKAPIIQMFHTLGEMKNRVAQRSEERELDVRIASERRIMGFADRIVAATPLDRQQMLDLYGADPERIEIIPCGVDLSLFRRIRKAEARANLTISPTSRLILFVGRVEPLKGIDTLLRAIALVVRRHPHWPGHLALAVIGGSAEDSNEVLTAEMRRLRALRAELGLEGLVTFLGAQSQETLPDFYSAAEMVVMPSHYESFGMVALEAMASGTPVIASDVGGLTYTVQDGKTGFLVPPQRPDLLADKIEKLLEQPALRRAMGAAGVVWAQRFGWSAITDQVLTMYHQLERQSG
ncbi:MAG TPA: glycosyltransferase family 1 protein [Chloroflexi bacterium]|nr:glycosyltransferase family 1 protein [Chloroflexota bacterium]